jgi:hypothetical protein
MAWCDLIAALEASTIQDQLTVQQGSPVHQCRVYHNGSHIVEVVLGPEWPATELHWIEVDPSLFDSISNVTYKIIKNQLVAIDFTIHRVVQLKKSSAGAIRTVKGISTVLLEDNEEYEFTQYYTNS